MNYQKNAFTLQKEPAMTFTKILVQNGSISHAELLGGGQAMSCSVWPSGSQTLRGNEMTLLHLLYPLAHPPLLTTLPSPSQLDYLKGNSSKSCTPKYSF